MKWFCPKLHHLISRFEGYFSSWHRTCSLKVCGDSVSAEMGWLKFPSFLPCLSLIRVSHRHFVGKSEEGSEAAAILFFTLGCHTELCSSCLLPQMVTYWACNRAAFPALMSSTSLVSPVFSPLMKLLLQATCFVKVRKSESRRESSQFQWVQLLLEFWLVFALLHLMPIFPSLQASSFSFTGKNNSFNSFHNCIKSNLCS